MDDYEYSKINKGNNLLKNCYYNINLSCYISISTVWT